MEYDILKLQNQLSFPIYLCAKELTNRYDTILKELNLTYTQYIVMMYFWEIKSSNVKELSRALLIDPSTLTPLLKNLEKKGYVTRKKSPTDERNLLITVTEQGLALKKKAIDIPKRVSRHLGITGEEAKYLYIVICKIIKNIKKEK